MLILQLLLLLYDFVLQGYNLLHTLSIVEVIHRHLLFNLMFPVSVQRLMYFRILLHNRIVLGRHLLVVFREVRIPLSHKGLLLMLILIEDCVFTVSSRKWRRSETHVNVERILLSLLHLVSVPVFHVHMLEGRLLLLIALGIVHKHIFRFLFAISLVA